VSLPLTEWWSNDVLAVIFRGNVTASQTEEVLEAAQRDLDGRSLRHFVVDAEHAVTYSADVRAPGVALLRTLRTAGATGGVAISRSPAIRMIGAAVAFVAGVRVEFVESRVQATDRLKQLRDERS
jgi:hypothetical protein